MWGAEFAAKAHLTAAPSKINSSVTTRYLWILARRTRATAKASRADKMIIPIRCFSCGKVCDNDEAAPSQANKDQGHCRPVGEVSADDPGRGHVRRVRENRASQVIESNSRQRRHGPATSEPLLLPPNDHDPRRPHREAIAIQPSTARDLEAATAAAEVVRRVGTLVAQLLWLCYSSHTSFGSSINMLPVNYFG